MKTSLLACVVIGGVFLSSGCVATRKWVTRTVDPVQNRVTATEAKNADQDKQIATDTQQIAELDRNLSRTDEKLTAAVADAAQKATVAGSAAKAAGQKADNAQKSADGAAQASAGARTYAENLSRFVDDTNKLKLAKPGTILFSTNQWALEVEAKLELASICEAARGLNRYVVEVQGFTDKTGAPEVNEVLSQRRAQEVGRFLVNECGIPLRNMTMLGSGYAQPVGDDKTRAGRQQNRRVEVRLFVPEVPSVVQAASR
jgi:outer membrane protein OmpA-like peptidoglycan-associated protein